MGLSLEKMFKEINIPIMNNTVPRKKKKKRKTKILLRTISFVCDDQNQDGQNRQTTNEIENNQRFSSA